MNNKNIVVVGKTGCGKSELIERISNGTIKNITGKGLKSKTKQTTVYSIENLGCNIADTPGLCDSESKDQIFLDQLVDRLRDIFLYLLLKKDSLIIYKWVYVLYLIYL